MHNEIIEKLCASGYPAHLVGGAVRDLMVGKDPHDFDIVTKAQPEEIAEVFQGHSVNLVGKSFGVTLVEGIEVATYRTDSYSNGNGAKNCQVEYADTLENDLCRRDLTVNALCLCPISGDLIDYHGGLQDLQNGIVKFVGDPDTRIAEDPCRILRACRFLAKLEGTFDITTLQALQRNVQLVKTIDPERIKDEIMKAMECKHPSIFFAALYIIGCLDYIFPGLGDGVGHPHGKHHTESVWEHNMLVGDSISSRFPLVRLAGYVHDLGKPSAYKHNGDGKFSGHEVVGAKIVDKSLRKLKFSNKDRETVVNLVNLHMIGAYSESSPKAIRKFIKTLHDLNVDQNDWLRIRISDRKGNINKSEFSLSDIKERKGLFSFKEAPVFDVNCLCLKGGDLIKLFDLTPGPIIGKLQKHLLNYVIENGYEYNNESQLIQESIRFFDNKS